MGTTASLRSNTPT